MSKGFSVAAVVRHVGVLLPAAVIAAAGTLIAQQPPHGAQTINCHIHKSACTQQVAGLGVTLDISPKPVHAMSLLTFTIALSGAPPAAEPYIDLDMPGMYMGPNLVRLSATSTNVYTGRGIIVKCPSGSRIWRATVTIPGQTTAEFIFDVLD